MFYKIAILLVETKIKYLLFGLKTKMYPKILFFAFKKSVFSCLDLDWGKKILCPDP
jgi:hypothetical protein